MVRFITGDECGVLKEYKPKSKSNTKGGEQPAGPAEVPSRINVSDPISRKNGITALSWMAELQHFGALHIDGSVAVWEYADTGDNETQYRKVTELPSVFDNSGCARPAALGLRRMGDKLCACSATGQVVTLAPFASNDDSTTMTDNTKTVLQRFSAYGDKPVTCFDATNTGIFALGGKGKETVLWDVVSAKQLWKAKNLPPDPQTLLQPQVWPTALCFMGGQQQDDSNSNLLCVGTAYHQVRIYDIRSAGTAGLVQRRPIGYSAESLLDYRVTALCPTGSAHELVVGDAAGYVVSLDIRKLSSGANINRTKVVSPVMGRYVGPGGSVRQLVYQEQSNRLACVGLDRMLRVYNATSRQQLHTVYMKQRLACVLVSDEVGGSDGDDDDDDGNASEVSGNVEQEDDVRDYVDSDNEEGSFDGDAVGDIDQVDDMSEGDSSGSESGNELASPRKRRRQ